MAHNIDSAKSMLLIELEYLGKTDEMFKNDLVRMGTFFELFGVPATSRLSIDSVTESNGDRFLKIVYPIDISNNKNAADSMRLIQP